jgi:hypothetical protein
MNHLFQKYFLIYIFSPFRNSVDPIFFIVFLFLIIIIKMAQQHPYQASVPANDSRGGGMQQSLFPAWHDRRYTNSANQILEEGKRMRGSFELLQGLVNEKQKEEEVERSKSPFSMPPSKLNKDENGNLIVASSLPSILSCDQQQQQGENSIRRSQSVRFKCDEDNKHNNEILRRSRSVRFSDENKLAPPPLCSSQQQQAKNSTTSSTTD